jgi:hypothetical protein
LAWQESDGIPSASPSTHQIVTLSTNITMAIKSTLTLALLSLFPLTLAQSSVVSLYLIDTDPQDLVASVITVVSSTTQYEVTCPQSATECGYEPPITVMEAGSTFGASLTDSEEQFTFSQLCTLVSAGGAVCAESAAGEQANFPGSSTTTYNATELTQFAVTITAGLEKLATVSATTTTSTKSSGTTSKASSGASSGVRSTGSGSQTTSGTKATASSSGSGRFVVGSGALLAGVAIAFAML